MLRRPVVAAALAGLATGLLGACGGDPPQPTDAGAVASPSQLAVGSGVPRDLQPSQLVNVLVTEGEVRGDTGEVPVRLGSRVRLVVLVDAADTLVVDGYGLRELVVPGRSAALELVADRAGPADVRLEQAGLLLTRLVVS